MATIADLESRLTELYEEHSNANLEIETTSMALIAALLREAVPTATHLLLDWGDQAHTTTSPTSPPLTARR